MLSKCLAVNQKELWLLAYFLKFGLWIEAKKRLKKIYYKWHEMLLLRIIPTPLLKVNLRSLASEHTHFTNVDKTSFELKQKGLRENLTLFFFGGPCESNTTPTDSGFCGFHHSLDYAFTITILTIALGGCRLVSTRSTSISTWSFARHCLVHLTAVRFHRIWQAIALVMISGCVIAQSVRRDKTKVADMVLITVALHPAKSRRTAANFNIRILKLAVVTDFKI